MAMVTPAVLNLAAAANAKDSRWLTLEVCREFQRNKCTRSDTECKFAHPPPHVEVQSGRVTACFDSIKVTTISLCVCLCLCVRLFKQEPCQLIIYPSCRHFKLYTILKNIHLNFWNILMPKILNMWWSAEIKHHLYGFLCFINKKCKASFRF